MAKEYFKEKKIEFEEFNVALDQQKSQEMIDKSGQLSIPVIDIDGKIIVGFDQKKIDKVLGL